MSWRKFLTIQFPFVAVGLVLPLALAAQYSVGAKRKAPDGWYVYPNEKLTDVSDSTTLCFNYSQNDWQVANERDGIAITRLPRTKHNDALAQQLPPLFTKQSGMPGNTKSAGLRDAMHFQNSWLIAYDAGEWGGGLWLTNEDGSEAKRIVKHNIRALVRVEDSILVLSGLSHTTMDFGNAFIFSEPDGLNISLRRTVKLDSVPSGHAMAPDGTVLFVSDRGLNSITKSGDLQQLVKLPKWTSQLYPNSIAISADRSVFIGMRMFVLRLTSNSGGYSQEWLLPNECRKFSVNQFDCVCKP